MILKSRNKSIELQILASLNTRMRLSKNYRSHFFKLQKGYEGEILFESFIEKLQNNYFVLSDLFLQTNSNYFQLDSIMITDDKLFLFEVKNFEGDYFYEPTKDRISSKSNEILNPHSQVERSVTLLRQLLKSNGISLPIEYSIVFVNPEFTLYGAPTDKPFIFPTQINRYLKRFDNIPLDRPNKNRFISDKLLTLHTSDSQFWQIPLYEFDHLRKGVTCAVCNSFMISVEGQSCVCMKCGHRETVTTAVLRCVEEFKLLFPEVRITTSVIYEWCQGVVSSRTILRILERNFLKIGKTRSAFFK